MRLPTVEAEVTVAYDSSRKQYIKSLIEVEVLTVHFAKRKMRVRYRWIDYFGEKNKIRTCDISAEPFFDKYGMDPEEA